MEILYSDKNIAVCIKPVGLDSEHELPKKLQNVLPGDIFPVHRLDKNVGGVMVFARTKAAAAVLNKAIADGKMEKEYVALVHGTPPEKGDWTDLLWKDSSKNKVYVVNRQRKGVKSARLTFQRLTNTDPSLVKVRLYTGRSHQIRVQFAAKGYPLLGDHKYGARDELLSPMLFSCHIAFPYGGKQHCYEALPDWAQV